MLGSCQKILLSKPVEKYRVLTLSPPVMLPQEKCAQYWPSDGSVSYGDITVELKKEEECESYTVRDLLVTNTRVRAWLLPLGSLWVLLFHLLVFPQLLIIPKGLYPCIPAGRP